MDTTNSTSYQSFGLAQQLATATPINSLNTVEKGREIRIEPKENGFLVFVGCKEFVFTDINLLSDKIKEYYSDPLKIEEQYRKGEYKI